MTNRRRTAREKQVSVSIEDLAAHLRGELVSTEATTRRLTSHGAVVSLTPKVFDTLLYFVEHRGRLVEKDELLAALWPDVAVEENNLGQAVSRIRSALGEAPGDNRYIITVPSRGYRFVADSVPKGTLAEASTDTDGPHIFRESQCMMLSASWRLSMPGRFMPKRALFGPAS